MLSNPATAVTPAKARSRRGYLGDPGDLIFLGSMQPPYEATRDPKYAGSVLTRGQKLMFARSYTFKRPIPLCIDHAECAAYGAKVPKDKIIGYATGVLVDRNDDCLITGYVSSKRAEMRNIIAGMQTGGKKWGLSAFTRFLYEDYRQLKIIPDSKQITHIGVTLNPAFADDGSWIFEYSTNPDAIARVVRDREIQVNGCLANSECMDAWGVAPNVAQHVVSVLDANIALPMERPTVRALPPAPNYPDAVPTPDTRESSMSTQSPPLANPAAQQQQTPAANAPNAPAGAPVTPPKANDPMEGVEKTNAPAAPNPEVIQGILAGLIEAQKQIKDQPALAKDAAITDVIGKVDAALKEHNLRLQDMPEDFGIAYYGMKNEMRGLREQWATDLQKFGGANNDFNKDLVDKMRSNATSPVERRQIASYVEANKSERESSQKAFEQQLAEKQAANDKLERDYKEQMEAKRKADVEIEKLRADNENFKRRAVDTRPITSALGNTGFRFYNAPAPMTPAGASNQAAPAHAPIVPNSPAFSFFDAGKSQVGANSSALAQFSVLSGGVASHSMVLDSKNAPIYNSADRFERPEQTVSSGHRSGTEGFTTATGFNVANSEFRGTGNPHLWAGTFALEPSKTSFGQSFGANNAQDPVFVNTYQFVTDALSRNDGMMGLPFNNHDYENRRFMNDSAIHGMSQAAYANAVAQLKS